MPVVDGDTDLVRQFLDSATIDDIIKIALRHATVFDFHLGATLWLEGPGWHTRPLPSPKHDAVTFLMPSGRRP